MSAGALSRERAHLRFGFSSSGLTVDAPFCSGSGARVRDTEGREYLDLFAGAGVCSLGHRHEGFVRRVGDQLDRLVVSRQPTPARAEYVEALVEVLPPELPCVGFFSTGAEAVEAALRIARGACGPGLTVAFDGAFHGRTADALAVSDPLVAAAPGALPRADVVRLPFPAESGADAEDHAALDRWESAAREALACAGSPVAAVIAEPIQGTAGNVAPVEGFLSALRRLADDLGAALVFDEVITGFGRTGRMFRLEHERAVPDLLVIGKGMANGVPVAAVAATERILAGNPAGTPGTTSSSFGANPLAMAAAHAALDAIRQEDLVANAASTGLRWLELLRSELAGVPGVAAVRGHGLMLALDLAVAPGDDRDGSRTGAAAAQRALEAGLLLAHEGPTLRLNPPLVFDVSDAEEATERLAGCLANGARA